MPQSPTKPIYVLNGPNLNLLGVREPDIYGKTTLDDISQDCIDLAKALGFKVDFRQTNHEGVLVDWIQEARTEACALVINPAAFGHTSVALLDALKTLSIPIVECHLSHLATREDFRHQTFVSKAAAGIVAGFGAKSYTLAIQAAAHLATHKA
jgi:3-dehydroquinate dehydratase-2